MHLDPHPIPLIKIKNNAKLDKYCRGLISENSDLYELKMALYDNSEPEGFLLLIWNLNMNLEASRILKAGANNQYLYTLVRGEASVLHVVC